MALVLFVIFEGYCLIIDCSIMEWQASEHVGFATASSAVGTLPTLNIVHDQAVLSLFAFQRFLKHHVLAKNAHLKS